MPHIPAPEGVPGIVGLFQFRPETAKPMNELVEVLLRGPSALSRGERELIATHVSKLNQTRFCEASHSAFAAAQLAGGEKLVEMVKLDFRTAPISDKLKSLLEIATKVQGDSRRVSREDVEAARKLGATDVEIHDTVLIAAAFCMYNRYVDGLAAYTPDSPEAYRQMAKLVTEQGYARTTPPQA